MASLLTNTWLTTQERIPELQSDVVSPVLTTGGIKMRLNITYTLRYTQSGMWSFCQRNPHQAEVDCYWIEHQIPDHNNMVDPRNATTCILYATMVSLPSIISATSITLMGLLTNFLMRFRKLYIFISGIIYILAGICTFTCLVIFITYVIQELEHKSQEKGEDGDPIFTYRYGYSLLFAMISFCCQELGGIALIYLSIARFTSHWTEKDRRLALQHCQLQPSSWCSSAQFTSFQPLQSPNDRCIHSSDVRRYHSTSELDPQAFPCQNNTYPPTQSHFTYNNQRLPSWYPPLAQHPLKTAAHSSRSAENSPQARHRHPCSNHTNNHCNDVRSSMANHMNHVRPDDDRYRAAVPLPHAASKQLAFFYTTAHRVNSLQGANPLTSKSASSNRSAKDNHPPGGNAVFRLSQQRHENWKMTPV
ncbi:hypothetical protein RvY_06148-2 [Ramazzottius varieornatus]|uniref:Voltage-dependent calcium channel gamma-5 subunit n=1 Tax=Ramazzottius varieornatus TaxID=947166 RepID=A0A1D1V0J9_RAMVA|nr:hypothetical protein RvY_06148-2 [Ramazzottius varieornatus]